MSLFLSGESHRQRKLEGYSPKGLKESDTTQMTKGAHTYTCMSVCVCVRVCVCVCVGLSRWHSGKESASSAGDMGLISGSGTFLG